jgi:hypothetical protein
MSVQSAFSLSWFALMLLAVIFSMFIAAAVYAAVARKPGAVFVASALPLLIPIALVMLANLFFRSSQTHLWTVNPAVPRIQSVAPQNSPSVTLSGNAVDELFAAGLPPRIVLDSPSAAKANVASAQLNAMSQLEATGVADGQLAKADEPSTDTLAEQTQDRPKRGLRIQFDRRGLSRHGLTFAQVVAALVNNRPNSPGRLQIDGEKLSIELEEAAENAMNYYEVRIPGRNGRVVSLRQLGGSIFTNDGDEVDPGPQHSERPAWVDEPPQRSGGVWRLVVAAREYATADECYRRADELLYAAAWERLQALIAGRRGLPNGERLVSSTMDAEDELSSDTRLDPAAMHQLLSMGIDIDFIRRNIVVRSPDGSQHEYLETVQRSVGSMKTLYTQLEFTPAVDAHFISRWLNLEQQVRVALVGKTSFLALSLIGLVYGLFKVDTLTRGYYTKHLFIGVPAAILAVVAFLLSVVRV